jgi:uncharacterized protein YkwD
MTKKIFTTLLALLLTSCIKFAPAPAASTAVLFVTSTLPPTRQNVSLPTETPSTTTPDASTTTTPGTPGGTESVGPSTTACKDSAVMIEDVTVPDNTVMTRGQTFTKTWRFMNNGKCNWNGYTIAFFAGDKMESPDSVPVPPTEAGKTVDVSVDLTAPSVDGSYTGFYVLKNDKGETLPIGIEQSFWLKILIGNATAAPVATLPVSTNGTPVAVATVRGPASCDYTSSSAYINEIAGLINNARTNAGLPALTVNAQLNAAAQGHSVDMACHNLLSHNGSDATTVQDRVAAAGYSASYSSEIIYGSGYPQTAFDWWMNDQIHRNEILNARYTEMGIGYAYKADTAYGGYYTVDFASP